MSKKFWFTLMALLVMFALVLTACGGQTEEAPAGEEAPAMEEEAEAPAMDEEEAAPAEKEEEMA